ncbi:uncharacterized protein LOC117125235 [Anneissia japonica]|uniref:uncharacterized protein LOC117125235 n=1 Tax=Anneissia japonica TaxID=1529436 RepID=UPI0014256D2E|nr:uncharacterized protein LOC117125235 [Anneissia japonica]
MEQRPNNPPKISLVERRRPKNHKRKKFKRRGRSRSGRLNSVFPGTIRSMCEGTSSMVKGVRYLTNFMFSDDELLHETISGKRKSGEHARRLDPSKVTSTVNYAKVLYPGRNEADIRDVIGKRKSYANKNLVVLPTTRNIDHNPSIRFNFQEHCFRDNAACFD